MGIWLGNLPADFKLKDALLGKPAGRGQRKTCRVRHRRASQRPTSSSESTYPSASHGAPAGRGL